VNVLSLFDGMSCGKIALDRIGANVENYYSSEIDNDAIIINKKNNPDIIHLGDVTKWREWDTKNIDLLIGGSPCQGFSYAGKQLNFKDPRSSLFFEFVNIKNSYKPKYFLLENVNMKQEYQDIISNLMGVQPIKINSSLMSAGLRDRLYWTNIPIKKIVDKNINLNDILENAYSEKSKSYCIDANYGKGSNLKRYLHRGSRQIVFTCKDFMNNVTINKPEVEECNRIGKENRSKWRFLTPLECERIQTVPEGYTDGVSTFQRYKMLGNGWTVDVIAHIFKGLHYEA